MSILNFANFMEKDKIKKYISSLIGLTLEYVPYFHFNWEANCFLLLSQTRSLILSASCFLLLSQWKWVLIYCMCFKIRIKVRIIAPGKSSYVDKWPIFILCNITTIYFTASRFLLLSHFFYAPQTSYIKACPHIAFIFL